MSKKGSPLGGPFFFDSAKEKETEWMDMKSLFAISLFLIGSAGAAAAAKNCKPFVVEKQKLEQQLDKKKAELSVLRKESDSGRSALADYQKKCQGGKGEGCNEAGFRMLSGIMGSVDMKMRDAESASLNLEQKRDAVSADLAKCELGK